MKDACPMWGDSMSYNFFIIEPLRPKRQEMNLMFFYSICARDLHPIEAEGALTATGLAPGDDVGLAVAFFDGERGDAPNFGGVAWGAVVDVEGLLQAQIGFEHVAFGLAFADRLQDGVLAEVSPFRRRRFWWFFMAVEIDAASLEQLEQGLCLLSGDQDVARGDEFLHQPSQGGLAAQGAQFLGVGKFQDEAFAHS